MGRHVLRRHNWGYSVCLCPIKRAPGLYGLRHQEEEVTQPYNNYTKPNIRQQVRPRRKTFFHAQHDIYPAHKIKKSESKEFSES